MTAQNMLALAAALLCGPTLVAQSAAAASAMERAGVVPGQRLTVTVRPTVEIVGVAGSHEIAGRLVAFDSAGLTLLLDDGAERRIPREEALRVVADAGRSRWRGVLAGWLASVPLSAFLCQNKKYECAEGQVSNLVGMVAGALVGWPQKTEVLFP
jgi:hypothetical protein